MPVDAQKLNEVPAASVLRATVTLVPAHPLGLAAYAKDVSTPGTAQFRHYLTTAQFASRFAPSSAKIAEVREVLRRDGLNPGAVSANGLAIEIHGRAGNFSRAFQTPFDRYRLVSGRVAYANTARPKLPKSIAAAVQGVVGLDNLVLEQPEMAKAQPRHTTGVAPKVVTGGPQPCTAATASSQANGTYTADELDTAYSFSSLYQKGDLGAGQTIAVYELESDSPTDISTFQSCYGTTAPVSYVEVDGGAGSGPGSGEAALDIENIIGAAPKAAQLVYQAPNGGSGGIDEWTAIVSQDKASIVSTSWGTCEPDSNSSTVQAESTLFQEAATQGQSIIDAAGDAGSEDCSQGAPAETELAVDDPGGQPYVTAVGGTTLTNIGPPPTETVWNEGAVQAGAGGGGISADFAMPSYQSGAAASLHVINANSSGTVCGASTGSYCRETPDVTLDADPVTGFVEYYNGSWIAIGGTSGAAPLFAAFVALTNASSTCAGTNVGFANPALYSIAGQAYSSDFYDITSGNNDYLGLHGGLYPSGVGYDMASGLGAPDGATLSTALCHGSSGPTPAVTGVSPSSGTAAGGTTVTLTGSGFTGATKVLFGTVAGTGLTVVNDSTITVSSPAEPPGLHNIYVTTPIGTSPAVSADLYTFTGPTVTGVSPTSGTAAGGTTVTLTGSGFTGATKVLFGTVAGTGLTVVNDSTITVSSPAEPPGLHNIYVTTPIGTSPAVSADLYTFTGPTVTGVSPTSGTAAGGTTVTLTGSGFTGATKVLFGTVAGTGLTVVNDSTITVSSPAEPPGLHNIYVTTPIGTSPAVSADLYTFTGPTVTGVSPTSGPAAGGTTVTLTGSGFTGATTVLFGTVAGTGLTVVNDSTITVVSPAEPHGLHNIYVTTPIGTSPAVSADLYTFT